MLGWRRMRGPDSGELEEVKQAWLFAGPLIRHEFRAKPGDLSMIAVNEDSMEPLLSSGDRSLIDVSRTVPVCPGTLVIWDGLGLVTMRIEHARHSNPRPGGPQVVQRCILHEWPAEEVGV